MRSLPSPRRILALAGLLGLAMVSAAGSASRPAERGFPLIRAYGPEIEDLQSFGIASDPRGLLYVANLGGVLIHDGAWWRRIEIGRAKSAFSVAVDAAGRVAVGGIDDLGLLTPAADGTLRFQSLLHLLPAGQRQLGQVMRVVPTAGGFAFLTTRWVLLWDGTRMTTVATFSGERPYPAIFAVGRSIYAWTPDGISRLAGGRLVPVPGGEAYRGRRVDRILPAGERPDDGRLLVSVRGEGLFVLENGSSVPFAPEASRWTAEKKVYDGCRLPDGRWALGTILGGILLLRPDGEVDQVIDSSLGLPDDFVTGIVVDHEGSLWLSLNNGLARIEVASPLSVIDRRSGLQGSAYTVARHHGDLWAGTAAGLFTSAATPEQQRPLQMRRVPGVQTAVWSLLPDGDDLLVGTAYEVDLLRGGSVTPVPGTDLGTAYVLVRSTADPDRVWVGGEDELLAIRRAGSEWRLEGRIGGFPGEVRHPVEGAGGILWCGTSVGGLVRVAVPPGWPARGQPDLRRIGPADTAVVARIAGSILVVIGERVLRLDETRGELVADPRFAALGGPGVQLLVEDAAGNVWRQTRPPSVAVRRDGGWAPDVRSLVEVTARNVETFYPEADGTMWMAGDSGIYRYAGSLRGREAALAAPLLRLSAGGRLLFGGAIGRAPQSADLPASPRRLRIELAPLSFRSGLRYQTRLDPLDAGWSEPTAEPFAELTHLPPGRYTLHARTVGPRGERGQEARWSFRVLPPWYLTPWALALWLGAALLTVRGYGRLRNRALRQRAARLEARVAEQTEALRRTVDELRRTQTHLETANARLHELSLQDDLTGIANRRRLQHVLEEEWSRARRHRVPVGFILLDLDWFKLLNDTRGHPEGDLCLQAVARYLEDSLRRTGDLVARYGGEEFAVLLPETDLAGALQVAEQLREGIEGLALLHEAAPLGRITASFGVASLIPEPGQRTEALIEAADLALYRAKTEGRNAVCANGSPSGRPAAAGLAPVA